MAKNYPTADRVRELLDYDPNTGLLVWRISRHGLVTGRVAGTVSNGYVVVNIDYTTAPAHRLIWLHVYGKKPDGQIDHIDGNRANNKLNNLRDVTRTVNQQNRKKAQSNNKTGIFGVEQLPSGNFRARIKVPGKPQIRLGCFPTAEDAYAAYLAAKRLLHEGCTI